jgi:hypothetical protein
MDGGNNMPRVPSSPVCEVIACEICMKEIPRDLAKSEEATGYVLYFCGDECYAQWRADQETGLEPPKPAR